MGRSVFLPLISTSVSLQMPLNVSLNVSLAEAFILSHSTGRGSILSFWESNPNVRTALLRDLASRIEE